MHKSGKYITFLPEDRNVLLSQSYGSLLELALANGIKLNHSCGGHGTCGTCRIFIRSDLEKLTSRNEIESEMAVERDFADNERLACQLSPGDELIVEVPVQST